MATADESMYWALDNEEYALVADQVTKDMPRLFAVCELDRDDDGKLLDVQLFAWGMAFPDRAELISTDGHLRMSCQSVHDALSLLSYSGEVGIVWQEHP